MVKAICCELQSRTSELDQHPVKTIYFGGGTPSLLSEKQLTNILTHIYRFFKVDENAEITLECNPDDLNLQTLSYLKKSGINRLSIGVQSFEDDVLKLMNRAHSSREAFEAVRTAKDVGFENITIDLIYGIPNKGMDYWKRQLDYLLELDIPHLSAYCLTIEPKTVFSHWVKEKKIEVPADDASRKQFEYLRKRLLAQDYEHYEISNFAKKGFLSQHNSAYWLGAPYLGIGPSAHSYDTTKRRWNIANNPLYIQKVMNSEPYFEEEKLSGKDQLNEYILTRLRTKWGMDLREIEKKSQGIDLQEWKETLQHHLTAGNLEQKQNVITLSEQGLFLADHIAADLFV